MSFKFLSVTSLALITATFAYASTSPMSSVGNWALESKSCGGIDTALHPFEAISIGNKGTAIAFRSGEESASHLCNTVDGYMFELRGGGSSDEGQIQVGVFQPYKKYLKCWYKKDGKAEGAPYLNESKPLEGDAVEGTIVQNNNDQLHIRIQSSVFCDGQSADMKLRRY